MSAEELIARLAAEGEFDSSGSFTLDPAAALEKLREFQLRDPTRFVLSWVRAATLLGASRIDIEIDADDVWLRFDGEVLSAADFEALWTSVVGRRGSARVRACRELALGINGAFTWEAKSVTVRSGELEVGFDRRFAMSTSKAPRSATPRNSIHAKRPIGWDLVRRRMLDVSGQLPEELMLAHACAFGAVPIYLEGRQLNPVSDDPSDVQLRVMIDDDDRHGRLWLRPGTRSQLRVLVAGVEVAVLELPFGAGWVDALVDDPLLPLDLSQEKPVEGERWHALLECVSRARWGAWFLLATREDWSKTPDADALIRDIFASPDASWTTVPGAMAFADRLVLPRAVTNPEGDILPLASSSPDPTSGPAILPWPDAPATALTLGDVVRSSARGVLFSSPTALPELGFWPSLPVLQHASSVGLQALGHVVLDRPAMVARYQALLVDLRPLSGTRPLPDAWLEQRVRHGDLDVRVGWKRGATAGHGVLVIGREGKCLVRHGLPPSWGPLWIEVEGPFPREPGPAYDELLATAVLAGLGGYHDLLAALDAEQLSEHERERVIGYLGAASGRWSAQRLAELRNIPIESRRQAVERWRGGWGVPSAWVDPPGPDRGLCDHPLMDLAWLEQNGRTLSLRDVQRAIVLAAGTGMALAPGGVLRWLAPSDIDPAPPEVLRLTPPVRAVLAAVFGGALERFDPRAWQRREVGPHRVPERLPEARVSLPLSGPAGEHGLLALAGRRPLSTPWSRLPARGARLRLLGNGHDLGWMDVALPIGSFYGVIEVPHARAVAHADVACKDEAWRAAAAVVESGALALARAQLEDWIAGRHEPDDRSRIARWTIDLEHGRWPSFASALASWQATLAPEHPLRVDPPKISGRPVPAEQI